MILEMPRQAAIAALSGPFYRPRHTNTSSIRFSISTIIKSNDSEKLVIINHFTGGNRCTLQRLTTSDQLRKDLQILAKEYKARKDGEQCRACVAVNWGRVGPRS